MSDLHSQTIHTGGERECFASDLCGEAHGNNHFCIRQFIHITVAVQPCNKGWVTMLY